MILCYEFLFPVFVVVQSLSCVRLFATFTVSQSVLKFMSIESVMPSSHHILCHSLLPSIFPSIRVFSNELALHIMWPKYWIFSICLFNEYSGLISFRMDWFDLLAVQESSPASQFESIIFQCSAFFIQGE